MRSPPLSHDEYRALVEASPVMMWRAGTDAKCNYFNETWLGFTGRTLEQEAGDGWTEGVHPDDFTRCLDIFVTSFHTHQAFEMEYRMRRHDGVYRWLLERGAPYTAPDGGFAGFIGSCVDIEERKRAEAQRRTTLSMVAHELRTPLAALQTYIDVVQAKVSAVIPPSTFDRIARQVHRFSRLIDDLSDTARVEDGNQLTVSLARVELDVVVRRVAETYSELVPRRSSNLRFEVSIAAGEYPVLADADRLEQVLVNLLDNACKFSVAGGRIGLALSRDGASHRIEVTDCGIGIPPSDLARVTSPYVRGSNIAAGKIEGAGMGLAIATQLLAGHGGKLAIESEIGKGTKLIITLPRHE